MELFPGANSDGLDLATRSDGFGQIKHAHAGDFRHKDLAPVHLLDAAHHKADTLFQRQPEASHPRIGERDTATLALLHENRYHAAPTAHDIAVAGTTEARVLRARVSI